MDPPENHRRHHHHRHRHHPNPWFVKLLSLQSDIVSEFLLSLTTHFFPLVSFPSSSASHPRPEILKETLDAAVSAALPPTAHGGGGTTTAAGLLVRRAVLGFVGAAYVGLVLTAVAVAVGVGLVRLWVEEPVYLQENLYFDYTNVHPFGMLDFGYRELDKSVKAVPVGHTCNVRLVFVMPESDYNRKIGNFQARTIIYLQDLEYS